MIIVEWNSFIKNQDSLFPFLFRIIRVGWSSWCPSSSSAIEISSKELTFEPWPSQEICSRFSSSPYLSLQSTKDIWYMLIDTFGFWAVRLASICKRQRKNFSTLLVILRTIARIALLLFWRLKARRPQLTRCLYSGRFGTSSDATCRPHRSHPFIKKL